MSSTVDASAVKDRAAAAAGLLNIRRLPSEGLVHIALHKYKAGTYTPLDNAMNGFWFACAERLPMWMAPNMVTLIGLLFNVLAYVLVVHHQGGGLMEGALPPWVNVTCAICLFLYQTLDAMDGKHARRTGNSSPLGQLFDHGCDALSAPLMTLTLVSSLQMGPSYLSLFCILAAQVPFFQAQWAESVTGALQHSMGGIFGVTETQLTFCAVHLFAACVPADFWKQELTHFSAIGLLSVPANIAVCYGMMVPGACLMVLWQIWETFGKASMQSWMQVVGALCPVLAASALTITDAGTKTALEENPQAFLLGVSVCMTFLCTQMVVCNMACVDMSPLQPTALAVLAMAVAPSSAGAQIMAGVPTHAAYLLTPGRLCAFVCVCYGAWVLGAISEICTVLDINCLTINPVKKKKK
jgi:phosphatidylglycerophosphate synthase